MSCMQGDAGAGTATAQRAIALLDAEYGTEEEDETPLEAALRRRSEGNIVALQEYLAHNKQPPPSTLQ